MRSFNLAILIASFGVVGGGCGGAGTRPTVHITCDVNGTVNGTNVNQCVEFIVGAGAASDVSSACAQMMGTVSYDTCRTSGNLGECDDVTIDGMEARVVFFPDATAMTQVGAMNACANLGGQYAHLADTHELPYKRIFATSAGVTGAMVAANAAIGATGTAAELCTAAATGAGLSGTWIPWLSDDSHNAIDQLSEGGPWNLVDGKTLLFPTRESFAYEPQHAIDEDEKGQPVSGSVWTGASGGDGTSANCDNWTDRYNDSGDNNKGAAGDSSSQAKWSYSFTLPCQESAHVYCIEQ